MAAPLGISLSFSVDVEALIACTRAAGDCILGIYEGERHELPKTRTAGLVSRLRRWGVHLNFAQCCTDVAWAAAGRAGQWSRKATHHR